ncbi:MAG: beta-galactosidase [Bdellovibrionota bacterium]
MQIREGAIAVNGTPTLFYGGELPYFRVRDEEGDEKRTWLLWEDRLRQMKAAHMNLVATYVPWDYHELEEGRFDFSGVRDLRKFLGMCHAHRFYVHLKPGPLITAEWPRGMGTFGAVPAWWKEKHPEALVRRADGSVFKFFPFTRSDQAQPTYLHPAYLSSVRKWFAAVAPIIREYIFEKPTIVFLQIDNETNFYWGDVLGDVDWSETSLAGYRALVQERYGRPDGKPPEELPMGDELSGNMAVADWFDYLRQYTQEYQLTLRGYWEELGISESSVLFTTNDSPFGLPGREVLLPDHARKNRVGLHGLDTYPKMIPLNGALFDQPFQPDYHAVRFREASAERFGEPGALLAAEIQGGMFSLPLGIRTEVTPAQTNQLIAKLVGRGMAAGSFYVAAGGINADGSDYDYQALIGRNGKRHPRFEAVAKWGSFLNRQKDRLLASRDLPAQVGLLVSRAYETPAGGMDIPPAWLASIGYPGLYGLLLHAGVAVKIIEAEDANASDFAPLPVVFFANPGFLTAHTAGVLGRYVEGGGTLVNFLSATAQDRDGSRASEHDAYAALFSGSRFLRFRNAGFLGSRAIARVNDSDVRVSLAGHSSGVVPLAGARPFLWKKSLWPGRRGEVLGYEQEWKRGRVIYVGADFFSVYNSGGLYGLSVAERTAHRDLIRGWIESAGVRPALTASDPRDLVWIRRTAGGFFVYWIRGSEGGASMVQLTGKRCAKSDGDPVRDLLGGWYGTCLRDGLIELSLPANDVAVLWVPNP